MFFGKFRHFEIFIKTFFKDLKITFPRLFMKINCCGGHTVPPPLFSAADAHVIHPQLFFGKGEADYFLNSSFLCYRTITQLARVI